jgi:hypothetical protein
LLLFGYFALISVVRRNLDIDGCVFSLVLNKNFVNKELKTFDLIFPKKNFPSWVIWFFLLFVIKLTNSDCHTCYSNLVDCVFEDDCGYRGETSVRNVALWIKKNCDNPVLPTCAPCSLPERTTPCPLLELSTSCPTCVEANCPSNESVQVCPTLTCDRCPVLLACPEETTRQEQQIQEVEECPICLPCSVSESTSECQQLIDQVVGVKNNCVKDLKSCNNSLFEKIDEIEDLSKVSNELTTCLTGYASCQASIPVGAFQSLLVNFTWSNVTDHLRLDLSESQNATIKAKKKLGACLEDITKRSEECGNNTVKLETLVFSLSEDNRYVC